MNTGRPAFYLTDVFGKEKYGGGQLATFTDCEGLNDLEMQQIAHELNFPETTFITNNESVNGGFNVRIFTPRAEIDFAGHPTLGTSYIIRNFILDGKIKRVKLNLKVGQIPVEFSGELAWMDQIEPEFGDEIDKTLIAKTLSLSVSDLETNFSNREVSTGLPFTVVPLRDLQALKNARINTEVYYNEFCKKTYAKGLLIFTRNSEGQQLLRTRVFVNYLGIPEDPATGSASGCLAGYLVKHQYLASNNIDIKIGQGYEINRPSEISLKAFDDGSAIRIRVGGKVELNGKGYWYPSTATL